MCREACIEFGARCLAEVDVRGKAVIEVGSLDVNGSLRPVVESLAPGSYTGVDIRKGPGVDLVCDVGELLERFGPESFDLVIATEMLEHVRDWRRAITNLKNVLKTGGVIIVTVPSRGFRYHGYPFDFWRYELEDVREIFSDFTIETIEAERRDFSVFMRARKPEGFREKDTSSCRLYSIVRGRRIRGVRDVDIAWFKLRYLLRGLVARALPRELKDLIKRLRVGNA